MGANSTASPTAPRGSSTPGHTNTPRIPGSLVTPGSQGPRGSLTPKSSDTPKISGSQDAKITGSQRQLYSEEVQHNPHYMKDRLQSGIAKEGSPRDNQMAGGKDSNTSNRNQGYLASSEPNSPTIASSGCTITQEKQDSDLK